MARTKQKNPAPASGESPARRAQELKRLFPEACVGGKIDIAALGRILGDAALTSCGSAADSVGALRERLKELGCLYQIAHIAGAPGIALEEILQRVANLLPHAWQYSEHAWARIGFDDRTFATAKFGEGDQRQCADIVVGGKRRGFVEVGYAQCMPEIDEGPFLKEERNLIEAISRQMALIVERKLAEDERAKLQSQLQQADRLAVIGLLAAGVAHELNEPLGNILGFAQLARSAGGLPDQARQDIERIESASLYAREVIKNLLVFARQMPPSKAWVDLNETVRQGLGLFEARCAKAGIELTCSLAPGLPHVYADPSQLKQVLVNLVVNALQAMPFGGALRVETGKIPNGVRLSIEDTGCGISDETKERIFDPFFTTKDIGEGTGLGLSVVHGIVASHGGVVSVDSMADRGTRFVIHLPTGKTGESGEKREADALFV
ncbi:MAG: Sensor protein ZraS [candidate division BRC1 bacterium ADurb.BinA364]|nr:MAG: Sensor protein ZraS [candidate division BRC1 bacterium ADurb.BinA364]